jgi:Ca2+-binding RTX toxin-like protein
MSDNQNHLNRATYDDFIDELQIAITTLLITGKNIEIVNRLAETAVGVLRCALASEDDHLRNNIRIFFNNIREQIDQLIDNSEIYGVNLLDGGVENRFDPSFDIRIDFRTLLPGTLDIRAVNLNTGASNAAPGSSLLPLVVFEPRSEVEAYSGIQGNVTIMRDLALLEDYISAVRSAAIEFGVAYNTASTVREAVEGAREAFLIREMVIYDYVFGTEAHDNFDGGNGNDIANYLIAAAGIHAFLYDQTQNTGDAAGDTYLSIEGLSGSDFDDDLRGDGNTNALFGTLGDDLLAGLEGRDYFRGGEGFDLFHYRYITDGEAAGDEIQDFVSGEDRVSFSGEFFGLAYLAGGGIESWRFAAGTEAVYATSQFIFDASSGQLWYDQDGSGAGSKVLMATLQAGATMAAGDFLVL